LAYFSTTKTMRGNLVFTSKYFDANEWMEPEPADGSKVPSDVPATSTTAASEKLFDRWDFTMDGKIKRLKYDTYDLSDLDLKGHFTPNKMTIEDFGMKIGASDLHGNGTIFNAWDYMFDNQTVSGVINLESMYFDANYFMTDAPAATAAPAKAATPPPPAEVMLVPENVDMTMNLKFDKVKYTNMDLNNLDGQVIVKNGAARLKDCTAKVLGGQVGLTGEYNTQIPSKPAFNIDLALQNMGFKDAFQYFATVKALAPVAQLMDGKFNTTLSMSGLLGKDMTPDFTTLSAAGFIETLNAIFNNFKPLNEVSSKLHVPYLNKLELKNSKNWFEIKNGMVTIKPFNVQMQDVAMQIGGTHGISNEMNYQIVTKTPRKALGAAANSGLDFLSKEGAKYGVNLAQGEFINVRFDLTGSLFSPKVAMKVLGSDGQSSIKEEATATIQATVDKAKDSLSNVANRELGKAKQKAADAAQKAADSLQVLADKKLQEATQAAKDKVGKEISDEAAKKAQEAVGDKGQKSVEEAKKKLEGWDPFKKKKNN
ncbi:MAG: AsmA-like C-terminal region-containing protein, partial [Saprospiraceae bacterium]